MPCWHVNTWKLRHPSFELCRNSSPCYTTHVSQPILNQRPKTHYKFQIQKFSSHTSLVSTHVCQPILNQCPKTHYKIQSENVHLTHPYFELCRNNPEQITPCMWANPSWTNVPKHTTNFRSENFHLTHPCFPRMCANPSWTNVPRHTTNFNPKIFISHIPVWTLPEQITPHICASPEPMLHRHTTKSQTLRVSSHTSLFWTLPEQLHITPHMWANPSWTKVPRHTTNFRSEIFHLTHPRFELCRNNSEQMTPRMCANPEPTFQRYTTKPQTLKIFISHIPVLNFAGTALHVTPRMWANPSWTNVPRHTTNFRSENVHLTHPCFELCRNNSEQMTPRMCANPSWTNVPKTHHKTSDQDFHLTHPSFELCRGSSPYYTTHVSQPILNQRPKHTLQTSDPNLFISHIPVLNFAGTACHVTPRIWANPSCTNVPRYNTTTDSILQTHPHPTSQNTPLKISMFTV